MSQEEVKGSASVGHGGSWARYFENKNAKLREQFRGEECSRFRLEKSGGSSLFEGVTIFVNGHTVPSQQQLKHLMAVHGGGFENYYHRPPVTHFICSHLPMAKIRQIKKERNPVPVVQPEWIVASIEAGKLLPIRDFSLEELREAEDRGLDTFLTEAPSPKTHESDHPWRTDSHDLYPEGDDERELAYFRNAELTPAEFIKSYFEHSRLHFIGTWKMRIEAFAQQRKHNGPKPITTRGEKEIVHVDMDCFFASVAVLNRPELKEVPFVVCHSNKRNGTAEISCANYPARELGIHAGSFISTAMKICPTLEVVPYQFERYQEISEQVYEILMRHSSCVEPVSCDEAYLDVTGLGDPEEIAKVIRSEIEHMTQCAASAGIGPNKLLAKIATTRAKPNGQFRVRTTDISNLLDEISVRDLPGVGWSLVDRLKAMGIETVHQLKTFQIGELLHEFGEKTGKMIWDAAHGVDTSPVQLPKVRKSVSAECNWGIRLKKEEEVKCYLREILHQVLHRMSFLRLKGRCISLKIKTRKESAPVVPLKFLGCGSCDNISRSHTMDQFTDRGELFMETLWNLFLLTETPIHEIRGLGVTISKLDNAKGQSMTLLPLLQVRKDNEPMKTEVDQSKAAAVTKRKRIQPSSRGTKRIIGKATRAVRMIQPDGLVLSDIDPEVLAALPEDLRKEIVQTIPLERDNLFVTGNDKIPPDKQPIEQRPPSPLPSSDVPFKVLLSDKHAAEIPEYVDSVLRANLEVRSDAIVWSEEDGSMITAHPDPVLQILWRLQDWVKAADDGQMLYICDVLKSVRRHGALFPEIFGACSSLYIRSIQDTLCQERGYELDLGVFLWTSNSIQARNME